MFNCLLYRGQQGIITKVSSYLKKYLQQNEKIAQLFFYTIIAIAEDQMACYKYNVNKLCGIGEKIDYQPNRKKPPVWVKRIFEKNGIGLYNSKREEIIQKYLIREKKKDLSTWNIENGDLQTLCYVSNCGLSFDNHEFSMIMRKIFPYLLSIISNVEDCNLIFCQSISVKMKFAGFFALEQPIISIFATSIKSYSVSPTYISGVCPFDDGIST